MATISYYLLDTKAAGINHLDVQVDGSAPATADFAAGSDWGTGAAVGAADRYSEVYATATQARASFTATPVPTTIDTTNGNGWRLTPTAVTGSFASGNWTFNFRLKDAAGANGSDMAIAFLVWKSSNADGSSGSAVGTRQVTADVTNINTGSTATLSYDPSAGAGLTLSSEYLFLFVAAKTLNPALSGFAAASNLIFRTGSANKVTTTDFSSGVSHSITGAVTCTATVAGTMLKQTAPTLFTPHPALQIGARQRRPSASLFT